MAVRRATSPLRAKTRISAGPATPAAIPIKTKIPAPIIAPTPIMVASMRPISRLRRTSVSNFFMIPIHFFQRGHGSVSRYHAPSGSYPKSPSNNADLHGFPGTRLSITASPFRHCLQSQENYCKPFLPICTTGKSDPVTRKNVLSAKGSYFQNSPNEKGRRLCGGITVFRWRRGSGARGHEDAGGSPASR